ncbi:hypothetical protein CR513_19432, partial [Mucuna pruriens]
MPSNMCLNSSFLLIELPIGFGSMFKEFKDVFPKEVPHGLPPLRGIEHHIDLTLGASFPNRAAYRTTITHQSQEF